MIKLKAASETVTKPRHPSAITGRGKKLSGFAIRAILSIFRLKSNGGGAPHSKQWGMQGAAAG